MVKDYVIYCQFLFEIYYLNLEISNSPYADIVCKFMSSVKDHFTMCMRDILANELTVVYLWYGLI